MGAGLHLQKRLAAAVLKCGKKKIWLDPSEVLKISQVNSRASPTLPPHKAAPRTARPGALKIASLLERPPTPPSRAPLFEEHAAAAKQRGGPRPGRQHLLSAAPLLAPRRLPVCGQPALLRRRRRQAPSTAVRRAT